MPFDPVGFTIYKHPTRLEFWAATPAKRRIFLAEALEHEEMLPVRWMFHAMQAFDSDGAECGCAINVMAKLWGGNEGAAPALGIGYMAARAIFGYEGASSLYGMPIQNVTPRMVAEKLRAYKPAVS